MRDARVLEHFQQRHEDRHAVNALELLQVARGVRQNGRDDSNHMRHALCGNTMRQLQLWGQRFLPVMQGRSENDGDQKGEKHHNAAQRNERIVHVLGVNQKPSLLDRRVEIVVRNVHQRVLVDSIARVRKHRVLRRAFLLRTAVIQRHIAHKPLYIALSPQSHVKPLATHRNARVDQHVARRHHHLRSADLLSVAKHRQLPALQRSRVDYAESAPLSFLHAVHHLHSIQV